MNNEFEKLLTSLLDEYQECGDVNSVVEKAVKENGATKECSDKIENVNDLLDAFAQKAESLQLAKDKGKNRRQWMVSELDKLTEGRSEEEKTLLISEIHKTGEEILKNSITQE